MSKSKQFAEAVIDSMVDESGHCGERGLSYRQFSTISQWLDEHDVEGDFGCWHGDCKTVYFTLREYTGRIGKYEVTLQELWHFNARCTVKSIDRVYDKSEKQLDEEKQLENSKYGWHHEVGEHLRDVTCVCKTAKNVGCGQYGERWLYTFTDGSSMYVWFTGKHAIEEGDTISLTGTVKALEEFNSMKQTQVTRCKVKQHVSA